MAWRERRSAGPLSARRAEAAGLADLAETSSRTLPPFNAAAARRRHAQPAGDVGRARTAATTSKSTTTSTSAVRRRRPISPILPGGRVPYQPWALARRNEIRAGLARGWPGEKERLYTDPQTFCLYTVPRATTRGGFEIVQAPGYVAHGVQLRALLSRDPAERGCRTRRRPSSSGWAIRAGAGTETRSSSTSPASPARTGSTRSATSSATTSTSSSGSRWSRRTRSITK